MRRNGMLLSESYQFEQGAATSTKQHPPGMDDYHQKDAGSHGECQQKPGTQKHSTSDHPHASLGKEGR